MDNRMFFITFPNVAYALQYISKSLNKNNWPNKKNDVITDLGGEGDFPMFRFVHCLSLTACLIIRPVWSPGTLEAEQLVHLLNRE